MAALSGAPSQLTDIHIGVVNRRAAPATVHAARNLPITIDQTGAGSDSSSSSVPPFDSSAHSRMAMAGRKTR